MTDESQEQQSGEHVREKAHLDIGDHKVGEQEASVDELIPLEIVRIENTEPGILWGSGSKLIASAPDTVRLYVLTHEQIEVACEEIDPPDDVVDQEELETAADDEAKLPDPPALNAAARICEQLNRIGEALGADAIPFLATSDLDDVGRVEFRLMDIASALERLDLGRPA